VVAYARPAGRRAEPSRQYSGFERTRVRHAGSGAVQARAPARRRRALSPKLFAGASFLALAVATALTVGSTRSPDRVRDGETQPPMSSTIEARRSGLSAAYAELSAALKSAAYARLADAMHGHMTRVSATSGYDLVFDSRYLGASPGIFARNVALATNDEPPASSSDESAGPEVTGGASPAALKDHPSLRVATAPTAQVQSPPVKGASVRGIAATGGTTAAAPIQTATVATTQMGTVASSQTPSLFERLVVKPYRLALAYASTGDATVDEGPSVVASGRYDRYTAVYDISAHTVYMPDGTRLEAHSGLGSRLDDPRHVDERMRGATPPALYDLEPRESLFHGVRALRLKPVDNEKVYGRAGLLAHTYMLGPNGDSNGWVSFKNYNAFLRAYSNHQVKRLAVVARLD